MKLPRIALFYGGNSPEHQVSISSAENIFNKLVECGYECIPIWVSYDMHWYVQPARTPLAHTGDEHNEIMVQFGTGMFRFVHDSSILSVDLCFPIIHGNYGENGIIQGVFEACNLPYIGCGLTSSALGMHKHLAKQIVQTHQIPTVPWKLLDRQTFEMFMKHDSIGSYASELETSLGKRICAKPDDGGSSVGVHIIDVTDLSRLRENIEDVFRYSDACLFESYIGNMIEIECAVLEDHGALVVSQAGSIIDPQGYSGGFLTYDSKYAQTHGAYLEIPAPIESHAIEKIRAYALNAAKVLRVQGFARVDFFYQPKDDTIYFNEINTLPGMTATSHFPRLIQHSTYAWHRLFACLVEAANARYQLQNKRKYG
ncbi:MAG: D-alanine--D-alanine ligase [Sphaerochaetaceae bacterium]|jgi:D-alanine-D-alanine ligase|nr:D-alanine--D-alanine ligase [Sphaerochaetaceae bacterium]MDX9808733.1 D-alanine--D-alanine ligase [Sphaerochaetaceae bacterium]NLV84447.1 D-alanine--D-alanine ligase [Spirochaetales bacterium]